MFSLELLLGILIGFLGFMTYDMVKHILIRSVIICVNNCDDLTLITSPKSIYLRDDSSEEKEHEELGDSNNEEDTEVKYQDIQDMLQGETVETTVDSQTDDEEEDIENIITKVRNKSKSKKTKTAKPDMGDFLKELKQLSDGLMKSIAADEANPLTKILTDCDPKEMIKDNPHMQGVVKMLDGLSKGEGPSAEDMKQMQEGMTEMLSSFFNGELTTEEKETERRDSEIVLHRLREIHNEESIDE